MLFLMFGGLFGSWFDNLFSTAVNNTEKNMKYVDHVVSDSLLNVKFGIEESYILKAIAYKDPKEVWTIGIGLVNIFDDSGRFYLKVYQGLTLSALKIKMNKTNLTDLSFVFNLMRNYTKGSNVNKVFKDLDSYNIPYDSNLADGLIDFYYNSGSAYKTSSYSQFLQDLRFNVNTTSDLKMTLARAYVKYRLSYLESFSSVVYGGWIRRVQIFADRIGKNDLSMEIKKSSLVLRSSLNVRDYILTTYFYRLTKRLA